MERQALFEHSITKQNLNYFSIQVADFWKRERKRERVPQQRKGNDKMYYELLNLTKQTNTGEGGLFSSQLCVFYESL